MKLALNGIQILHFYVFFLFSWLDIAARSVKCQPTQRNIAIHSSNTLHLSPSHSFLLSILAAVNEENARVMEFRSFRVYCFPLLLSRFSYCSYLLKDTLSSTTSDAESVGLNLSLHCFLVSTNELESGITDSSS